MPNVLILSPVHQTGLLWQESLSSDHETRVLTSLDHAADTIRQNAIQFLVIDSEFFDSALPLVSSCNNNGLKAIVIGRLWNEEKQIQALVKGYSGYCEADAAGTLLSKATKCILNGDIWINRHLVPKVLDLLVNLNNIQTPLPNPAKIEFKRNLVSLTTRELEVASMISKGNSNKVIAKLLNISERTVKAHLTSIFQKLNVNDRLHLAILFKENH